MTDAESVQVLPMRPSAHFTWDEFSCHDAIGTPYPLDQDWRLQRGVPLARELEWLRVLIGPFSPTSVYRTWEYHCAIYAKMKPPGNPPRGSQHLDGRAADVPCPDGMTFETFLVHVHYLAARPDSRIRYLKFYQSQRFVHLDIRKRKTLLVEYA